MNDRDDLVWRTSSKSGGGACVEVALDGNHVHVRDSKDPGGPVLTFDRPVWRAFIEVETS
ncbi:DUF397 domain-containing protein [Actinoplanes palleronii]|uniref:DUF397 domain-containing protein n=1 Tax=Actinoplanes palleronii TaxID=113570 RepID=A0ABQ4B9Z2_9ACTN|nr:DUF397 domain-containing protein [Actinoplanes palleronii]GIE67060.1 hypothetical protein Apa02nite_031680 [Actinoplanes palleronii]